MMRFIFKNKSLWSKSPLLSQISESTSRTQQSRNAHINKHEFQKARVGKYLVILAPIAVGTSVALYANNCSIPGIEATKPIKGAAQKVIDAKDTFVSFFSGDKSANQNELQKMHVESEARLQKVLDALKGEDQTEAIKRLIDFLLEKEKQNLNIENQKNILRIQAEYEAKLSEQLKLQSEAHADHLRNAVSKKEEEVRRAFKAEVAIDMIIFLFIYLILGYIM